MAIVHECGRDGCTTLTMGELCLEHEAASEEPTLALRPRLRPGSEEASASAPMPLLTRGAAMA